jgi:serine/threonine-protein kinase
MNEVVPPQTGPAWQLWQLWRQGQQPDVREFLTRPEELSPADLVAVLRVDQDQRWRRGERIPAENYLQQFFSLDGEAEHALDLVYSEFLLREELGEAPAVQKYAERFPELAAAFRLQVELHRALNAEEPRSVPRSATPFEDAGTVHGGRVIRSQRAETLPAVSGYELMGLLGRGGMGVVYKAWQVGLKRLVALKMLPAGEPGDQEQLSRFRAESEAVARLQHPNIVQVHEVGEQDGRPFFSLELVEGGSLEKRLGGKPQPAPEAARLIETLARAIHAAHQCGIIHRDLKPANILLQLEESSRKDAKTQRSKERQEKQRDGSEPSSLSPGVLASLRELSFLPKITDFGLAKRLEADEAHTRTGAIMGTPNYMSPEQASGRNREVGPATDIYSLGAILYELLTGRPPFNGATPLETLEQVRSAQPVPPRQLQPKLPRDLETICLKCLQKEPSRRYANALELAEDLGRFLRHEPIRARPVGRGERLWRWCCRNPLVASLTAGLILTVLSALAVTTGLYLDADHHRLRAEANFRRAEEEHKKAQEKSDAERREYTRAELHLNDCYLAVDAFLTRVSEERLLRQPDMEGLRKKLLHSAVEFLNKFAGYRSEVPRFEGERGRAYVRLANLTRDIESKSKAVSLYLQAQAIFEALVRREPAEPLFQDYLAGTYNALGTLYHDTSQFALAETMLNRADSLWEALARTHPGAADYPKRRARNQGTLAMVWAATGKLDRAEKAHRKAVELMEAATHRPDATAVHQHSLGICYNNLGVFLRDLSRVGEAAAAYQKAIEVQEPLVKKHQEVLEYRDGLALNHLNLGLLQRDLGRRDLAEKSYQRAAALFRELVRDHPRVAIYQESLANSQNNLGVLYRDAAAFDPAEKAFTQSAEAREVLAQLYPEIPEYKRRLAESRNNLASVYAATGRPDEAEKAFRQAIAQLEELVKGHPEVAEHAHKLAGFHSNLGGFYVNGGRPRLAEAPFQRAADLLESLTKKNPGVAEYRKTQGLLHFNQGNGHAALGRIERAEESYEKAVAILEPLHRDHPRLADYADVLALSKRALAGVYQKTRDKKKAEAALNEALLLREEIARAHPELPPYQEAVALVYNDLGNLYSSTGRPARAEEVYRKALTVRKRLVAKHPATKEFAVGLGGTCCNLGHLALGKGREQEALDWYTQAITALAGVRKKYPDDPDALAFLGNSYAGRAAVLRQTGKLKAAVADLDEGLKLEKGPRMHYLRLLRALTQIKLGNHAAAAADADTLGKVSPIAPNNLYMVAALYALAHQTALKDEKLTPDDMSKVCERYAGEAVKTLRRVHAAGLFDNPRIRNLVKTNPDLVSLHERPDFKKFVAELEKKAGP